MMFFFTYVAALLSTLFFVCAMGLLITRRDQLSLVLAGYLITSSLWIGSNAVGDVSYTTSFLTLTFELAYAGGVANLFFCVLLVDLLIDNRLPSLWRLLLYGLPCVIAIYFGFSPFAIESITFSSQEPAQIVPGIVSSYTTYIFFAALVYSWVRLFTALSKEEDYTRRMQLFYVLAGLIIISLFELIFDLVLPILGECRFYTLGPISSVFFAGLCSFAIIRYKFLDIRIAVQRGAIYSLLFTIFIIVYLVLIQSVELFFRNDSIGALVFSSGTTILIALFTVPALERKFRTLTDRWFFKGLYNYAEAMHTLSKILYTARTPKEVVIRVEQVLVEILRAKSVCITLLRERQTIPESLCEGHTIFPIRLDQKNIGYIDIGPKRSGEPYKIEDSKLLETFVYQAATSLSRYRLFQQVERHSKELEKTVEKRTQELRKSQESQRQMMADISHNLQTPLAILQARMDQSKLLLLKDGERNEIQQTIQSLSGFIYELLSLAEMESPREEKVLPYRMDLLLKEVVEEVTIIATAKNITVCEEIGNSVTVIGNERRMREAIMNLASNAIKYMRTTGPASILFTLSQSDTTVRLSITDNGIGIAQAEINKIFDRLYRAENIPYGVKGNGLGLAITKRLIELENGSIEVHSVLNKGTTFTITLQATSA